MLVSVAYDKALLTAHKVVRRCFSSLLHIRTHSQVQTTTSIHHPNLSPPCKLHYPRASLLSFGGYLRVAGYCTSQETPFWERKEETDYINACEELVDENTREETRIEVMGWNALHWAAFKGNNEVVKTLISSRQKLVPENEKQEVFKPDLAGVSPLHLAVERDHIDIVETLLSNGCDPNVRDNKQNQRLSSLHLAVRRKDPNINIISTLIKYGANVNQEATDRTTPLFKACTIGRNDLVALLVKHGANINIQNNPRTTGWGAYRVTTPLHTAVSSDFSEIVTTLLENGANVNYQLMDDVGESALHVAAVMGRRHVAEILLKFGANVNSEDCFGATPLDYANSGSDTSRDAAQTVVEVLVKNGGKAGYHLLGK